MPINIEEIKKLPPEEKLKIINELWDSIEEGWENTETEEESSEVNSMLEERLEKYEKGESKSYPWKEVEERIKKKY